MRLLERLPIRLLLAITLLTATLGGAAPVAAVLSADVPTALAGVDAQIEAIMAEWKVPGLAVAVVHDGEVVLAKGYGLRNVEDQLPVTADTLFAIGSNTKSFTVALLGMLNDQGQLDWDKPVREVLPDFRLHDEVASVQMTPRDLVTHRSGLPRHDLMWYATGFSRRELYRRLRHLEPSRPFRSNYQYQNLMFMTAGYLAEQLTGHRWEELVRERLLAPLGMTRSNFSVDEMQRDADFAYPYAEIDDQVQRVPFRNIDAVGPAGSINSSVQEMTHYLKLHLGGGKVGDDQLLSAGNATAMQTPQMVVTGPLGGGRAGDPEIGEPSYGLGLIVSSYRGHKHVFHGGGIDGFISTMEWLPRDGIGLVVLSNLSGNNPVPNLVARHLFDRLLVLEPIDWVDRVKEQQAKARQAEASAKEKTKDERKPGTSPSHALTDYVGSYQHAGYGLASVTLENGTLRLAAVGFTVPLEHYHYDIFAVPDELPPPARTLRGAKVTFLYNQKGDIDRLALPLDANVADVVFGRIADEAMRQTEFLAAYVGEYTLAGQTATVALRGEDTLTLTVPGQPTYTLVPERGTTFTLEGLRGYSVEFEQPSAGAAATAVTFHQPNGTFVASRK